MSPQPPVTGRTGAAKDLALLAAPTRHQTPPCQLASAATVSTEDVWRLTSFGEEREEVVNYAQVYDGKIILLFEIGVTQESTASWCQWNREVSPLHPLIPAFSARLSFLDGGTESTLS